jgi:polyisoprenoid-binding protein YceI
MHLIHDPLHSQIEFKIRHLMISTVRGTFEDFDVKITTKDATFHHASVECTVDVASIKTNIKDRDDHLKSADFFDVENHPKMTFKSTSVYRLSGDVYQIEGDLTIRGVSRPVTLEATYNGSDQDQYGQTKYGFEISGKINRKDWDLNFNVVGGQSTMLIGDEVRIEAFIQMM